jgi:hypothetical protein
MRERERERDELHWTSKTSVVDIPMKFGAYVVDVIESWLAQSYDPKGFHGKND